MLFTWPVMTAFLFGPLAVLLAASRPHGRRAWLWLIALTLWLSLWAAQAGGLLEEVIRASAVLPAGVGVPAHVIDVEVREKHDVDLVAVDAKRIESLG